MFEKLLSIGHFNKMVQYYPKIRLVLHAIQNEWLRDFKKLIFKEENSLNGTLLNGSAKNPRIKITSIKNNFILNA